MDHRILWGEVNSREVQDDGIFFYTTFYNAPPAIKVRGAAARDDESVDTLPSLPHSPSCTA